MNRVPLQPQNLPPPTEPGGQPPGPSHLTDANPGPQPLTPPDDTTEADQPAQASPANAQQQPQQPTQAAQPPPPQPPQPQPQPQPIVPPAAGQPPQPAQPQSPVQVFVNSGEQSKDDKDDDDDDDNRTKKEQVDDALEKLEEAIGGSQEVLIACHTAVPFYADTYTLDRYKVTLSKRAAFRTAEVMSMRVEDMQNCTANLGLFFGTIRLTNRIANEQPTVIGPFWRNDAIRIKRVTQGYIIAIQEEIDVTPLHTSELFHKLMQLGEDDHPNANTGEPPG